MIIEPSSSRRIHHRMESDESLSSLFRDAVNDLFANDDSFSTSTSKAEEPNRKVVSIDDIQRYIASEAEMSNILIKPTSYESRVRPRRVRRMPHQPRHHSAEINKSIKGIVRPSRYLPSGGHNNQQVRPRRASKKQVFRDFVKDSLFVHRERTSTKLEDNNTTDVKSSIRTASTLAEDDLDLSWNSLLDDVWTHKCVEFSATMEVCLF